MWYFESLLGFLFATVVAIIVLYIVVRVASLAYYRTRAEYLTLWLQQKQQQQPKSEDEDGTTKHSTD